MLWLRELVSAGLDSGSLALVDGMWRWRGPSVLATRLIELIEHRVEGMPPDEAEVMELVAYGEPIAAALLHLRGHPVWVVVVIASARRAIVECLPTSS